MIHGGYDDNTLSVVHCFMRLPDVSNHTSTNSLDAAVSWEEQRAFHTSLSHEYSSLVTRFRNCQAAPMPSSPP